MLMLAGFVVSSALIAYALVFIGCCIMWVKITASQMKDMSKYSSKIHYLTWRERLSKSIDFRRFW
jgi:hypothetical protein